MASEIRVDKINSLSGVGTVTLSPTGVDIAGITTVATFKVGTGVTASSDGDIFATGVTTSTTFSGNFSGGTISGTTGTFTGDVDIADTIVHTGDTNTKIRFPAADTISAETGGTERLRITSDGKVSVNHTATSGMAPLSVRNTDDDNINVFEVYNDNGNNSGGFSQASDGDGTVFAKKNDGTLSVMFRSDGNSYLTGGAFGVGTASPSDNIHLAESGATNNYIRFSNSNVSNGWSVGAQSGGRFQIVQNGVADRFFIESDGNVTVNSGNLIMGTAGKGIDFSAQTATSASGASTSTEVLDHYEEGTFTPYSPSLTVEYSSGHYIRIGSYVCASIRVKIPSNSNANNFVLDGLPFNCRSYSGTYHNGGYLMYSGGNSYGAAAGVLVYDNSDRLQMYSLQGGNIMLTNLDNIQLRIQVHYFV